MESFVGLRRIKENADLNERKLVCETLIKIIDQILGEPCDPAKRRVKLDSEEVSTNLLPYSGEKPLPFINLILILIKFYSKGGMETLFEIGFEEVLYFVILNC